MASQGAVLEETSHRPWPLPKRPWLMGQRWSTLLFLHWPVPLDRLRAVLPPAETLAPVLDEPRWVSRRAVRARSRLAS
jgi:uncharacterized protein YqjF (DUF2071 family)